MYLLPEWQNCVNNQECFVRMDIASAHGSREFKLPDGDAVRLRILLPWSREDVITVSSVATSPLFIADPALRPRAFFIGGGIPRLLYRIHAGLSAEEPIDKIEQDIRIALMENCQRWFAGLSDVEQFDATQYMLRLVRGEVPWSRAKGLFDDGIVTRTSSLTTSVTPVSSIAASVIIDVLTGHARSLCRALSSFEAGESRGFELERQVIDFLLPSCGLLPATSLDAKPCPAVNAHADISLT